MLDMGDGYFRFKQFALSNRRSAMKVGTDGVLLGAWVDVDGARRILDVGAGTGLIALMMAQRSPSARVTAVEIDPEAAAEARGNVAASPWADRVEVVEGDFLSMAASMTPGFDLIVSNPPFFKETLRAPAAARAAARHDAGSLPLDRLIDIAARMLSPMGRLAVIAPANRADELDYIATLARLSLLRLTRVFTAPGKPCKRCLWEWTRVGEGVTPVVDTMTLRAYDGSPSQAYASLTADFYL